MTDDELNLVPLPGSERPPHPGPAPAAAALTPEATVQATVVLRRERDEPGVGAAAADLDLVTTTLGGLGVRIVAADANTRRVRIEAPAAVAERVFGTSLTAVRSDDGTSRVREGGLSVPGALAGVITAVLGLDDRRQSRAHFRVAAGADTGTSFTPPQLGEIYRFPDGTDGSGQTIAIIELGGGYRQSDLDTYFSGLNLPTPSVTAVAVDGAANTPGDPNGADGEVLLDIEVAGALAPKASLVVYFAPNTDDGFLDAVSQAAAASPTPVAMSISWGQSEDAWTEQARTAMDQAFADAAARGCTVTVAAGDDGSTDRATDGHAHVDFPASSPHALACGGTTLSATGTRVTAETVWNNGTGQGATGGGVSLAFTRPAYQETAGVPAPAVDASASASSASASAAASSAASSSSSSSSSSKATTGGRGVPDVAAVADPRTGYEVLVDGQRQVIGGTSAVAPLWAALIARLAQSLGRPLGLVQPALYGSAAAGTTPPGFRDVTDGNNGAYSAAPGWDPCTGLGVPEGQALLQTLTTPTTPTNP